MPGSPLAKYGIDPTSDHDSLALVVLTEAKDRHGLRWRDVVTGCGIRRGREIIDAAVHVLSVLGPEDPFSLRSVATTAKIAAPHVQSSGVRDAAIVLDDDYRSTGGA